MSHREDQPKDFFDLVGAADIQRLQNPDLEKFKEEYFQFGEYELKKYQEFVKKQLATGKVRYGLCGANFSITFCPTGIGMECWAECYDTGEKQSLVDFENW